MAENTKRISLSQLSEYLTASPARRKSIIADAADPKPYIAQTYNAASNAISGHIVGGSSSSSSITDEISRLNSKLSSPIPDWQKQHVRLCIEALKTYLNCMGSLGLSGWVIRNPNMGPGNMTIAGLRINISPEAILTRQDGNLVQVGAAKFYFSKSKKLGKQRADYLGAIMNWYCEKHLKKLGEADYRCSIIVDLPGGAVHVAPKAKVRNRNNIEAACEEIVDRWPS